MSVLSALALLPGARRVSSLQSAWGSAASVAPFFDTQGRMQRLPRPPPGVPQFFVPVYAGKSLVQPAGGASFEPVLLTGAEAAVFTEQHGECLQVWLGAAQGPLARLAAGVEGAGAGDASAAPGFWLLDMSGLPEAPSPTGLSREAAEWTPLRSRAGLSVCDALASDDYAALLATARGMSIWHQSVPFCAQCGSRTEACRAGRNRQCVTCGQRFRPRIDPSVIVLVACGSRCLLGRKSEWPAGRFSTLAGFVEFGETFEECVAREVFEESGVVVNRDSISFVASQPWLFPRSMMVGFIVNATTAEITVDEDELQDVRWFEAEDVRASMLDEEAELGGRFHVPSKVSLAHTIIKTWLDGLGMAT